ncbi:hydrolase [Neobacillus terrae]|uniref:hydrolase n=1 Tax=Neobacillus terrae TaxID=3034837 RepID=UPI0014097245|nr:hydrolase [Neobacillus terrae]NHM32257.1 hydrolase [Neobacillus terrae]
MNEKPTQIYYLDIATGEIMMDPNWDWTFRLQATDDEIDLLREMLDEEYETDWEAFSRAHVPFLEYHKSSPNNEYDDRMVYIYAMIYKLGDAEAKRHVEEMGILTVPLRNEE